MSLEELDMVLPGSKKSEKIRRLPERQLRKQWEKATAWELQRHPERRRQKEKPAQPGRRRQKFGAGRKDRRGGKTRNF